MTTPSTYPVKRALISVSDKTGIVEFAREISSLGIEVISTGGTAALLRKEGITVTNVSDITGFPEVMDGRVKTLHPAIHGGLLAVLDDEAHLRQMSEHNIDSIDLAVINLYPFEETLHNPHSSDADIIENIDIGGPAMVRASAKNYKWTAILVNPADYATVLASLRDNKNTISEELRRRLAGEAFAHTAHYDTMIAGYFAKQRADSLGAHFSISARLDQPLRYGENPHQRGALYGSFTKCYRQIHGKELSYNNIIDIDAAQLLVMEFHEPTVAIIKHTNPCGVGSGVTLSEAWEKAFSTDTVAPFGGIVALNREVDYDTANTIHAVFTEVIIAPSFTDDALALLTKKKDRRLIIANTELIAAATGLNVKTVTGGFVVQSPDSELLDAEAMNVVSEREPTDNELASMMYAWKVAKHVKSNAIVYAAADRTLAVGAGQMSRVDSARIAVSRAKQFGLDLQGCAVASDAFFPFADGLLQCVEAGATAVIQPGGSVRDSEVIAAANENNIAMICTGMRHFRH
ncbi:MAG: bifunctional phosphoribosylaminoimidazolecarboxamide formyltransferase/IMP cyclohydrolase [Candidatus Kapabacteria bacterium]|nr:bifunctional phosphoribosylaminoimidazolecarboxamide formyltransferase/IMP cyclohydrolase [Candidatus Kapabacteria bacterium]